MDLVDEQHVAGQEPREDRREVPPALEGRPRGHPQAGPHLGGDDAGERRLAEPGRPGEKQVVNGLLPATRRLEDDRQVLLHAGLPDEVGEPAGAQPGLKRLFGFVGEARDGSPRLVAVDGDVAAGAHRCGARLWRAARSSSSTVPSRGSCWRARRTSSGV